MQSSASRSRVRATPLHAEFVSKHCIDMNTLTTIHHKCAHPCTFNCCLKKSAPPPRPSLPECRPYSGDISGMTWNPRAFFARNGIKMNRRLSRVKDLSNKLDFFGLQETHSTPERAAALQIEFPKHSLFWSHCTLQRGGLALGVYTKFLQRFSSVCWIEIQPGRIGKLELRGRDGASDLYSIYLDDQSAQARRHSFQLLSSNLAPKSDVLSMIFGDFNFVEHHHDRMCKTTSQFTGSRDSVDAVLFKELVLD